MKKLLVLSLLLICHESHAANFELVQEALIGWNYKYQAAIDGHQAPIHFTLRQCNKGPTAVMAQGYSPLKQCFASEEDARKEAQKWADKEEVRYREIQHKKAGR